MDQNSPFNTQSKGKIAIEEMEFYAFHGVHTVERKIGRTFLASVYIDYSIEKAAINRDLEQTVDYAKVYDLVKQEMQITEALLETVCRRIAWKLQHYYPDNQGIEVKISKNAPLVGGKASRSWVSYQLNK